MPLQVEAGKVFALVFWILLPKCNTSLFNNFLITTLKKEPGKREVIYTFFSSSFRSNGTLQEVGTHEQKSLLNSKKKKKKNIVSTQNHSEPLLPGFHKISANKKSVFRGLHFQEAIINYWRAGSNRRRRTVANLISVKPHYVIIIQTVFLKPLVK